MAEFIGKELDELSPAGGTLLGKLAAAFSGQVGVFLFGFASQVILARSLGPAGKGTFSLVVLIVTVVFTLFHGSLSSANSHFTGRRPGSGPGILGNSFTTALIWGGLVTLIFLACADRLLALTYPDLDSPLVKLTALSLIPLLLLEYSNSIVMGQERIGRFSLTLALREFIFLIALMAILAAGRITVQRALLWWVIVVGLTSLFAAHSAWSGMGFRMRLDPSLLPPMLKFSLQSHAANVATFLKLRFDTLLLAYFLDVTTVGYYTIATAVVAMLRFLPFSAAQVLIPYISWRSDRAGDEVTPRLCRITISITVVAGVLIALLGRIGIRLIFGAQFLPAYPALLILTPGAVLYCLATLISGDLVGRGLPHYAMKISILVMFVNVGMNLLLIPVLGMSGAALAASLSHALTGILFLHAFRKESGASLKDTLILKKGDFELLKRIFQPEPDQRDE